MGDPLLDDAQRPADARALADSNPNPSPPPGTAWDESCSSTPPRSQSKC